MKFLGVQCQEIREYPYYRCGACPAGFTGNGSACHDIDEVIMTYIMQTQTYAFKMR